MDEQPSRRGRVLGMLLGLAAVVFFTLVVPLLPQRAEHALYIGGLLVIVVLSPVWYFRFCRKCWREFKSGVADAGGWRIKRPAEPPNCPMCGALVEKGMRQCPACGEKLAVSDLTWLPTRVLVTGNALMILCGLVVFAVLFAVISSLLFALVK
jgi:hypothetical protein